MKRVVEPEILDELEGSDPRALRSRRDLRMINTLMGNECWIVRTLKALNSDNQRISELGAGQGELLKNLAKNWEVLGYDLQERPIDLPSTIHWSQGDFLEKLRDDSSEIVVGSLILHHFEADQLKVLGRMLKDKKVLVFVEPLRRNFSLFEGYLLWPFISPETRHDMAVSIRAGFLRGELPSLLGLERGWRWKESYTGRGAIRLVGIAS